MYSSSRHVFVKVDKYILISRSRYDYFTPDEEEIDAALAQVVAAHVDEELHVGVPEEGGLALGASLVLHFGEKREIAQLS